METLHVELVSAERTVWSGEATMVTTRTTEGKIGIMPRHEPLLCILVEGRISIHLPDGEVQHGAVSGGFLAMSDNNVEVICETAELAHEIDIERAQRALHESRSAAEDPGSAAAEKRAKARLSAVRNQGLLT